MIFDDVNSQEEAKEYVLKKTLIRPKTTIVSLTIFVLEKVLIGAIFGVVICFVFDAYIIDLLLVTVISSLAVFLLSLKTIAILCVECYQHYARDEYRRMCLCKPTCSEYAIIVLKKYNVIKAIILIYIRLTRTCRDTYKIDYP